MKTRKYIRLEIEFDMPILDLILDLQDLAGKYPDLRVWSGDALEFRTEGKKEEDVDNDKDTI